MLVDALNNRATEARQGIWDSAATARPQATLVMRASDRTAGSMPVWEDHPSAQEVTESRLATALRRTEAKGPSFQLALAEAGNATAAAEEEQPFGFGDLLDMVNPLQHLPVIGTLYRSLTGDEIRSSSRIFGGAVYGGALGAASGLLNTIVEHETGRDIPNALLHYTRSNLFTEDITTTRHNNSAEKQAPRQDFLAAHRTDLNV